jgi:GNAT superfamily N-acetyltransferase
LELKLTEVRRGPADYRYTWTPFEPNDNFTARWWDTPPIHDDDPWYVDVQRAGKEVARVELDDEVGFAHYARTPQLGPIALEIQFIEVSRAQRRQGIATELVARLAHQHPDRRLVAFSEEADDFWQSLGWERFEHAESPHLFRPLFIAPG